MESKPLLQYWLEFSEDVGASCAAGNDWLEDLTKRTKEYLSRTPEAGKLVPLDEEHIAKYYYEEYIEQVHATPALSGAKFDPWEQLPLDDKMRIAFIIPARKFCARFGSQPNPSHEIIGIKTNAVLDSIASQPIQGNHIGGSDKMVGPINIPSVEETDKVINKHLRSYSREKPSLAQALHDELKKWMENDRQIS